MQVDGFILKHPSPGSKGLACLRFPTQSYKQYSREAIESLKREWYFFWFSTWHTPLQNLAFQDLIDIFVVWDDLAAEIAAMRRGDCVVIRGGCETSVRYDLFFYPIPKQTQSIDLLYVARYVPQKRYDIAFQCVQYVTERMPNCKAVFLESPGSEPEAREWILKERARLGLEKNILVGSVEENVVNSFLNRARLCLFTSDEEGMCRSVLQTLLAERPLLCYRNTRAITRSIYDDRYFHFYNEQTRESIGEAAWSILSNDRSQSNRGSRSYLLHEKGIHFRTFSEWRHEILTAAESLYARDGQELKKEDLVPTSQLRYHQLWREFRLTH
jgi:glycosyltransferase involved in cell wall biosynthesis